MLHIQALDKTYKSLRELVSPLLFPKAEVSNYGK